MITGYVGYYISLTLKCPEGENKMQKQISATTRQQNVSSFLH